MTRPRILVVEDDALVRTVTVEYLADCGYPVLEAESADEAVVLLRENSAIGAVFSDVQMPGRLNGVQLAQWIARERSDVKVVLTSGQAAPRDASDWPLLAKPYRLDDVDLALQAL